MKKILFIFASVLMFTACGSNDIAGDYKAIVDDATTKVSQAKSVAELEMIGFEAEQQIFDLYKSNKEECDLLKERIARYLSDKDNIKLPEEEKTALSQLAASVAACDKAYQGKVKELTDEKNVEATALAEFEGCIGK